MKTIRLRAGKERSLLRRHPWIFEGSVAGGRESAFSATRPRTAPSSSALPSFSTRKAR